MAECISKSYNVDFDMITYIPMTKKDFRKRDYNQSYLLAKEISDILNIELEDLLIKVRKTKSQKSLSARERKVNVYGAFDVKDKEIVKGKNILCGVQQLPLHLKRKRGKIMKKILSLLLVLLFTFLCACSAQSKESNQLATKIDGLIEDTKIEWKSEDKVVVSFDEHTVNNIVVNLKKPMSTPIKILCFCTCKNIFA